MDRNLKLVSASLIVSILVLSSVSIYLYSQNMQLSNQNTQLNSQINALIDNYNSEIRDLQSQISSLTQANTIMGNQINDLNLTKITLQNQLDSLNSLYNSVLADRNNLYRISTLNMIDRPYSEQSFSQYANDYTAFKFTAQYAGYVIVKILYADVVYNITNPTVFINCQLINSGYASYSMTKALMTGGGDAEASFPVLPGEVTIKFSNTEPHGIIHVTFSVDYIY